MAATALPADLAEYLARHLRFQQDVHLLAGLINA